MIPKNKHATTCYSRTNQFSLIKLSNDASPPFRERKKGGKRDMLCESVYDGQVKSNISNLLLKMSCATICVKYISKSPSETLTPAVFLSDLSPPSHTHTDSRVHEKCWLVRLSLSLHPTTYSLSLSLSASFSCSAYPSSTMQSNGAIKMIYYIKSS